MRAIKQFKKCVAVITFVSLCFTSSQVMGMYDGNNTTYPPEAENTLQETTPEYVPCEIIVKFKKPLGRLIRKNLSENLSVSIRNMKTSRYIFKKNVANLKQRCAKLRQSGRYSNRRVGRIYSRSYRRYRRRHLLNGRLNILNKKHNIKRIQPVFRSLHRKIRIRNSNLDSIDNETRLRFYERAMRAPLNAKRPRIDDIYVVKLGNNNVMEAIESFNDNPNVEFAELNYISKTQIQPNDTFYEPPELGIHPREHLWGINELDCVNAWDQDPNQGEGIVVAVIDTGVDYTHPDLADNIWINEGEIPDNNIDDDGNGRTDDDKGWDFIYKDNDPMDVRGHGTHCAGTIAAVGNNGIGVIGVAPKAKIMAVKGLNDIKGEGSDDVLADCIYYAVDNGADILSCSWGAFEKSDTLQAAFDYAYSHGVISVAAAGNYNYDVSNYTPAGFENVMSVAAVDSWSNKAPFSNYGEKIDVSAPGVEILSTMSDETKLAKKYGNRKIASGYYWLNGTSMACPHVAGLAALVVAHYNPDEFDNFIDDVRDIIRLSATPFDCKFLVSMGAGIVNAHKALTFGIKPFFSIKDIQIEEADGDGDEILESNELIEITFALENIGIKKAESVTVNLDIDSKYISPMSSTSFDSIEIEINGATGNSSNPFTFKIGTLEDNGPFCKTADCTINITAQTEDSWQFKQTIDFTIPLNMRQITSENARPVKGCKVDISGNRIVWEDERFQNTDIFLYDLDIEEEFQISINPLPQKSPSISGDWVVWSDAYGINFYTYYTTPKKIFPNYYKYQSNPSISGDKVVWKDNYNGNNDIYLCDLSTGEIKPITNDSYDHNHPVICGNKIVWVTKINGNNEICLYDLETNQEEQIISTSCLYPSPSVSGNKIVWADDYYGNYDIYLYDAETGGQTQITYNSSIQSSPSISGDKIVWEDYRNKNCDIYCYDLAKEQEIQITGTPSHQMHPVISGNKIVWHDTEKQAIFMAELPSSEQEKNYVINPSADDGLFGWVAVGEPETEGITDPFFVLLHEGSFLCQDIDIPDGASTVHISAKVKCSDSNAIDGFPYLYAYVMEGYNIPQYLHSGITKSEIWTTIQIDKELDLSAKKLRVFLKRSNFGVNDTNIAYFDDVSVTFD